MLIIEFEPAKDGAVTLRLRERRECTACVKGVILTIMMNGRDPKPAVICPRCLGTGLHITEPLLELKATNLQHIKIGEAR